MTTWTRVRRWALTRLVLEAAALFGTIAVASRALSYFVPAEPSALHASLAMARNVILAGLLLAVYTLLVRRLERRSAREVDPLKSGLQFPAGAVLGIAMLASVYGILWVAGIATFGPGTGIEGLGAGIIAMFLAAVFEELVFRAVLFRIVEQACGTTAALVASAAIFGFAHGANPGATLLSDVAIAIEAGLLLGAAFALTRNLWLAIGIHTGWNFAEGNLFGALVSGTRPSHTLIRSTLTGPDLLTGGPFGPEASVVSMLVCGCAALILGILVVRRQRWQPRALRLALDDSPVPTGIQAAS
jgi:uncharacterized protein